MLPFLKKRLAIDTSSEAIRRITDILDENGIQYEIRHGSVARQCGLSLGCTGVCPSQPGTLQGKRTAFRGVFCIC